MINNNNNYYSLIFNRFGINILQLTTKWKHFSWLLKAYSLEEVTCSNHFFLEGIFPEGKLVYLSEGCCNIISKKNS